MSDPTPPAGRPWHGPVVFIAALGLTFVLGLLAASISERRVESLAAVQPKPITGKPEDPASWKLAYPREYASYLNMQETTSRTKHGGSDPRDLLAETPANVVLFAGYAFAVDYKQARGHVYAVQDVKDSGRDISTKPATCWTCKSPDVPRLMAQMGTEQFYAAKAKDLLGEVTHSIGCADCHDPTTNALTITRPALVEAFRRQGRDIKQVSHQEMRSLVCAQCHVEYHFKGPGSYLTLPWDKGLGVEEMEAYYDEAGFKDWSHGISKAPMIKMQHPDYEVFSKGIHAFRGVSCADCHMPYRSEGGAKFTDHQVRSPLLNIASSCAVCHRWSEADVRSRVEAIQDKVAHGRAVAEEVLAKAHFDIAACMQAGAGDDDLKAVRILVRKAQLRWDYVAANNGLGFHAPQECQRILGDAASLAQECRVECARLLARQGFTGRVRYPDWSSKEKAQALIRRFAAGAEAPDLLGRSPAGGSATVAGLR